MTPRDERHAFAPAEPDDCLNFGGVSGQDDSGRRRPQMDEGVGFVSQKIRRVLKQTAGPDEAGEFAREVWVHSLER